MKHRIAIVALFAITCPALAQADDKSDVEKQIKAFQLDPQHAQKMAKGLELFKKQVRAILKKRCLKCHGGGDIQSEFDLSTRKDLLKGGAEGVAFTLGKAKGSRLMDLVEHREQPFMPYNEEQLTQKEITAISTWIDLGAPYDEPLVASKATAKPWTARKVDEKDRQWWAFQPLASPQPPKVKDAKWPLNDIDRFVLKRLEDKGINPNGSIDRRRYIRRATFDLIGLPPTPEEITEFVNDKSPDAFDRLLTRLLESQHYGERWARHWLDVARFAESSGFEHDYNRDFAFHYRDFVIKALNADMPYDQFVRWQLAGDEFAPDDPLALMATGFLGAGVFPTQITKNEVERTRYDALDDMAATSGSAMLGLTIGCARCHDHKFDPIPQADYYRFLSTFTTTVRSNIDLDLDPAAYKRNKAEFDKQHAPVAAKLKKFEAEELPRRFAEWEKTADIAKLSSGWQVLDLTEFKSHGGATLTKQPDGSILATEKNPQFDKYTFVAVTKSTGITGFRIEALAHPSFVRSGPGRAGNGNFDLTNLIVTAEPLVGGNKPVTVKLQNAKATFEQKPSLLVKYVIDNNKKSGWAVDPQFGKDHAAV
ncbi:MAG: hypothetical protein CMJ78_24030, partial [Planctomycetaceae bacterium]|nr:hypothetical protein [Planctomycetaceae bacterium]